MHVLLIAFYFLAFITTALNLTFPKRRKIFFADALGLSALILLTYPLSLKIPRQQVLALLASESFLRNICLLQIVEALAVFTFSIGAVERLTFGLPLRLREVTVLLPSSIVVIGNSCIQLLVFGYLSGFGYGTISIALAITFFAALTLSALLLGRIVSADHRTGLKIIILVIQLVMAMFIPSAVSKAPVPVTPVFPDLFATAVLVILVGLFAIVGLQLNRLRIHERIHPLWRFLIRVCT